MDLSLSTGSLMAATSPLIHSRLSSIPSKIVALKAAPLTIAGRSEYPASLGQCRRTRLRLRATLRSPRGFGPEKKKKNKTRKPDNESSDDEEEERREGGVIPEIVTNRMMSRMALTVGSPLLVGLLFFPLFYYLKKGLKVDVPTWVPFIVSFVFFGTALAGVSYGIVSASWDPMREGSFWGWKEARKNWPVFWESFWGRSKR